MFNVGAFKLKMVLLAHDFLPERKCTVCRSQNLKLRLMLQFLLINTGGSYYPLYWFIWTISNNNPHFN